MTHVLQDFLINTYPSSGLTNVERKKHLQKIHIIKHLYINGTNTNAEINNTFKLSLPTSMAQLNQLIAAGIVEKQGQGDSVGGRKPDLFGLKKHSFFVLSIQIERFRITLAILDNMHQILFKKTIPTIISKDFRIVEFIHKYASELITASKINSDKFIKVILSI